MHKFIIYFYKVRIININFTNHCILLSVFFASFFSLLITSYFLKKILQYIVIPESSKYFNYKSFYALMLYKHILLKTKATRYELGFIIFGLPD